VTLLSSPLLTLKVLAILLGRGFKATLNFILNNSTLILTLISLVAAFLYAPGPHEIVRIKSVTRDCIVSWVSEGLCVFRVMVGRPRDNVECRIRHRAAHIRAVFGATHCQGHYGC
jgi:hypothetical protein